MSEPAYSTYVGKHRPPAWSAPYTGRHRAEPVKTPVKTIDTSPVADYDRDYDRAFDDRPQRPGHDPLANPRRSRAQGKRDA